jgi:drug/metabolite transporter (DMT)-like permease
VLVGVFFTSTSAILIRLSTAPPLAIAAYRMALSALLMAPSFLWLELHGRVGSTEPSLRNIRGRDLLLCIASGLFLGVHFAAWISSLSYTTVADATVLVNTHPVFIMLASAIFLRERPDRTSVALVLTAFAGSIVLTLDTGTAGGGSLLGNGLAIGGAAAVSGYFLIGRMVRGRVGLTHYTFIVYLTAALALTVACIVAGVPLSGFPPRDYLVFAALAVFPTLLGHSVFNWALRYLLPTFVSVAVLAEPAYATVMAIAMFHEYPSVITVSGGIVVIGAIAAYLLHEGRRAPVHP